MTLPATLIVGSDHAGYRLKEACKAWLTERGVAVTDVGTHGEESVDYPDFVHPVASAVERGEHPLGLVVCGSGQGATMTANKHQGIRCALCWSVEIGRLARRHNDANVLSLPERFVTLEEGLAILEAWLSSSFEGGRHARRVGKIACS